MAAFALTRWHNLIRDQDQTEATLFPSQAVEFLRSHRMPDRLFAYYDWGGYAVWKLYPQYRVFVDGRADLYGDDLLHQFQKAIQLQTGWEQVLDGWGVDAVLIPPSCGLAQALALDDGWRREYAITRLSYWSGSAGPAKTSRYSETYPSAVKVKKCVPDPCRICETSPSNPSSPPGTGVGRPRSVSIGRRCVCLNGFVRLRSRAYSARVQDENPKYDPEILSPTGGSE